jgi:hypothetical protein
MNDGAGVRSRSADRSSQEPRGCVVTMEGTPRHLNAIAGSFDEHERYHKALDSFTDSQVVLVQAAVRLAEAVLSDVSVTAVMSQLSEWSGVPSLDSKGIGQAQATWCHEAVALLAEWAQGEGRAVVAEALEQAASIARRHWEAVKPRPDRMSLNAIVDQLETGAAAQRTCAENLGRLAAVTKERVTSTRPLTPTCR